MSKAYRFWSLYKDSSCNGSPSGVYAKHSVECATEVASNGLKCAANETNGEIVGYVSESCYDSPSQGFEELYKGKPYIAYDYSDESNPPCENYGESSSYQASGDCEVLFDGNKKKIRSAVISSSIKELTVSRNVGAADCPGEQGVDFLNFTVPVAAINNQVCQIYPNFRGGLVFYNTPGSSLNDLSTGSSSLSAPTPTPTPAPNSNSDIWTIIGIVVGGMILLIGIILVVCCLWKRTKQSQDTETPTRSLTHALIARGSAGTTEDSELSTMPSLWNDDVIIATRIPRNQVIVGNLICRGGFGEIYKGTYNREAVAIKMLFPEVRRDLKNVNVFLAEAKLMAGLVHPHIVRFVGVSWGSLSDLCVLTELMKGGDLRELLKEYHANGHPQGIDQEKLRIACHVAQALTYLHSLSPIVIHRDLKSKNVLLTENLDAKLTDFGVSREQQENTMTAGIGTMLWMAPEVMMAQRYDEKADIFSFGVLLSELDLQLLPYSHAKYDLETGMKVPDTAILQKVALGSLQVSFSASCLASVVQLGRECVALNPRARPSSPILIFRLQTIMKELNRAPQHEPTYII